MDLYLDDKEIAFRDEVRAFLRQELTPQMKRAERLNPSFLADPQDGATMAENTRRAGLGRAVMAGRAWRTRLDADPTLHLRPGV